jgi:ADP-ribose pyrophosphatase YjhB (NUDIX family)
VGETLEEAMTRELLEEARIVPLDPPRLHGVFLNRKISVRDHVAVFVVRRFRTLEVKQPDREIAAAGFFPVAELPQDTSPGTAQRLEEINGATPLSPFW